MNYGRKLLVNAFQKQIARYWLGVNREQFKKLMAILPEGGGWTARRQELGRVFCLGLRAEGIIHLCLDHKGRVISYAEAVDETITRRQYDRVEALAETSFYFYKDGTTAVDSRCPDVPVTRIRKNRRAAVLAAHEFGSTR